MLYIKEYCETNMGFKKSTKRRVKSFEKILGNFNIPYRYSISEGQDINAGGGQLRKRYLYEHPI